MKTILNRRSIRKYKDKPVEKDKVDKLLRAAMQAPSAANQQPWEFIVVEDKEILKKLSDASPYSKPAANSAVTFVLLSKINGLKFPHCIPQDMGAAAENILLEACDLDLGAVWMGIAPVKERMDNVRKIFDLTEDVDPFALISIGYPDEQENKFIDRFDEKRVHYNKWK
jgi:nitroreductase